MTKHLSWPPHGMLAVATVCLGATLPYLPTITAYFLGDDFAHVQLFTDRSPFQFFSLFTRSWVGSIWGYVPDEFRPFTALTFQIDSAWGGSPIPYHVTNLVLHVLNAVMVFVLARFAVGLSLFPSAFGGALFAAHPIQSETVGWISGRVDSLPSFFFLASVAAFVMWRKNGSGWLYAVSLVAAFCAYFSKHNTLMLLPTLVLFDVFVGKRRTPSWAGLRPYVPLACLTAGYLVLRVIVFGNAARENGLAFGSYVESQGLNLQRLVFDSILMRPGRAAAVAAAVCAIAAVCLVVRSGYRRVGALDHRLTRSAVYFGPVWWLVTTLPNLAAGYSSTRHVYIATAGVATAAAVILEGVAARWRIVSLTAAVILISLVGLRTVHAADDWRSAGQISAKIQRDLEREVSQAPRGSLILVDTPFEGRGKAIWLWSWALPYGAQVPFTRTDLTSRAFIVEPLYAYCCEAQWLMHVQAAVRAWAVQSPRRGVSVLSWDRSTGGLQQRSYRAEPETRSRLLRLGSATAVDDAERQIQQLLRDTLVLRRHG